MHKETKLIRVAVHTANRAEDLAKVRGNTESLNQLITALVNKELEQYVLTGNGYAKVGDMLQMASAKVLSDDVATILSITPNRECLMDDSSILGSGAIWHSRIVTVDELKHLVT